MSNEAEEVQDVEQVEEVVEEEVAEETQAAEEPVEEEEEEDAGPVPTNRVHVTNLPWSFQDEDLAQLFSESGSVVSAKVVTKNNGDSRGFGFVAFGDVETASNGIATLNNRLVENRRIGVVYSTSNGPHESKPREFEDGEDSPRLHIREINPNVTDEELKAKFEEFGSVKSCKIVRNRYGKSRGYAFLDFDETEPASAAKAALHETEVWEKKLLVLFSKSDGPRKKSAPKNKSKRKPRRKRRPDDQEQDDQEEKSEVEKPKKIKTW